VCKEAFKTTVLFFCPEALASINKLWPWRLVQMVHTAFNSYEKIKSLFVCMHQGRYASLCRLVQNWVWIVTEHMYVNWPFSTLWCLRVKIEDFFWGTKTDQSIIKFPISEFEIGIVIKDTVTLGRDRRIVDRQWTPHLWDTHYQFWIKPLPSKERNAIQGRSGT